MVWRQRRRVDRDGPSATQRAGAGLDRRCVCSSMVPLIRCKHYENRQRMRILQGFTHNGVLMQASTPVGQAEKASSRRDVGHKGAIILFVARLSAIHEPAF